MSKVVKQRSDTPAETSLWKNYWCWKLHDTLVGSHEYDGACNGMHLNEDCSEGEEDSVCLSYCLDFP